MNLKRILAKNYINAIGWRTNKRYVLIESDDWGSIRMPNRATYNFFLSKGLPVDKSYFDTNDSLESADDLTALFEVLSSVKDKNGHSAVMTPLAVSANPNFEAIEQNGKREYIYESVTETYKRNSHTENSHNIILQGIAEGVYCPQFHGREHLHVKRWMEAVNSHSLKEIMAFAQKSLIGAEFENTNMPDSKSYMAAFGYDATAELDDLSNIIKDGLNLFETIYGYRATSFCPPCGVANNETLESSMQYGIMGLQAGQHLIPQIDKNDVLFNKKWGTKSSVGQVYWRRNCTFEPSRNQNLDWADKCLEEINIAFRWGKPAVINSHRVNFIGSIFPKNREQSLRQLLTLLKTIVKKWPDVEFINSEQLLKIITTKY